MAKNIEFNENIVKKNKIPILMYVPEWIQLFYENTSKNMQKIMEKLQEQITKEKNLREELENSERRKKILMNKILVLSNKANEENDSDALYKMEEAQNELITINERIPLVFEELEIIPGIINDYNTELLKETIKHGYNMIKDHKEDMQKVQDEVNEIRKKLASLIQKKADLEVNVNKLYSFIHGMVGPEHMEQLDQSFLEE